MCRREKKSFSGMDFNWIKEENRFGVCVWLQWKTKKILIGPVFHICKQLF